ncbi:MAG: hypothetical protein ABIS86_24205 [Streptosporangiaceae bacterium]
MSAPKDQPGGSPGRQAEDDRANAAAEPGKLGSPPEPPKDDKPPLDHEAEQQERRAAEDRNAALKGLREADDPLSRAESARSDEILKEAFRRFGQSGSDVHMKFNFFQDTVEFGGGLNMGDARTASDRPGELGAAWVASHVEHFVRPSAFGDALDTLRAHHLVLLEDHPGTGRTAGALNLLTSVSDGERPCYLLSASESLAAATWKPPVPGAAYLLDLGGSALMSADDLDLGWIDRIAACLGAVDSHLVVLTGRAGGALAEATHSPCVIGSLGSLDLVEIIVRRVLGSDPSPVERAMLVDKVTAAGGAALLADLPEPRFAVHLAEAMRGAKDLKALIAEMRDPKLRVRAWFGRHRDPDEIAFMLAVAVLENATFLTVSDAAVELHKLLDPVPENGRPPRLRFRERLSAERTWIILSDSAHRGDPQRVRLADPALRVPVLEHAWLHLDGEREPMLRWIRRLVNDPDYEVRTNTAVSLSLFARNDHVHAVRRYLRPWAADDSARVRESAAMTLAVLGADPELTDLVWAELHLWTDETNPSLRRRATAAAAVGGPLGAGRPEEAFRILRRGLDDENWSGLVPVASGVVGLVGMGCETDALRALVSWSDPEGELDIVRQALLIFVSAAFAPLPWAWNPGVPLVIADGGRNRRRLTRMLGRALNDEISREYALKALRRCVTDHAEDDLAGRQALAELLSEVIGLGPRQAKRIIWHLDRWARDPARPSAAAGALHATLTNPTSTRTSR